MRIPFPAPGRTLRGAAAALVLSLVAGQAVADPEQASDPLLTMLAERGLLADAAAAAAPDTDRPSLLRRAQDRASRLTDRAMELVGVHYRRGGASAQTGFDCSGFTRHVFETSLGLVLPRRADDQATAPGLVAVRREDLRPGDLVFFNTLKRTFSHVGIYVGGNRFIHSPRTGKNVRTEDMSAAYWASRFNGARRAERTAALDPALAAPAPPVPAGG